MAIDVGVGQKFTNDEFWMSKISQRLDCGKRVQNERLKVAECGKPLINLDDGVIGGFIGKDMQPMYRDSRTNEFMQSLGYDPNEEFLPQLRFRLPQMYTSMMQGIETANATGETTVTLVHLTDPMPRLFYCRISPKEVGYGWLVIDLAKFGGALTKHNSSVIEDFADLLLQRVG